MEYIQLTQENLQKEHICCSMTEKKGDHSVTDKKGLADGTHGGGACIL